MNTDTTFPQQAQVPPPYGQNQWKGESYYIPPQAVPQHYHNAAEVARIRDWLPWSIINLLIGWIFAGILPLIFSIICRNRKSNYDVHGARTMSTLALVFNILVTLAGIAGWIGFIVAMVLIFKTVDTVNNLCLTYPYCK